MRRGTNERLIMQHIEVRATKNNRAILRTRGLFKDDADFVHDVFRTIGKGLPYRVYVSNAEDYAYMMEYLERMGLTNKISRKKQ